MCRRDGAVRHVVATMAMAEGIPGDGLMMTGFVQDVTERRALEEQLVRQAFHDALTDLPNRRLFLDRLDHAVERSRRAGDRIAILHVDVDDFAAMYRGKEDGGGRRELFDDAMRMRARTRQAAERDLRRPDRLSIEITEAAVLEDVGAAVVELAGGLGLSVVAEGVEDGEQLRGVLRLGCHLAKGHHVARQLLPSEAARWITV